MFGVVLNGLLPEIILIIVLAVVLGWSGTEALLNGVRQNAKETKEFSEQKALAAQTAGSGAGNNVGGEGGEKGDVAQHSMETEDPASGSAGVELTAVVGRAALAVDVEAKHRAGGVKSADKTVAATASSGDLLAVCTEKEGQLQQELARFLLKFPDQTSTTNENVRDSVPRVKMCVPASHG
jgi:hypothetical protein